MVLKASKATGPVKISGRRKDDIKGVHSELFEDAFDLPTSNGDGRYDERDVTSQQQNGELHSFTTTRPQPLPTLKTTSVMLRANSKMASSILSLLLAPSLFLLLVTPRAGAFLFSLPPCRESSALRPRLRLSRQAFGVRDDALAKSGIVPSSNPSSTKLHSHAWKRLATQAGEQAINWIIPAIAIRILFGGFRALWGNKRDDEDDEATTRSGLFGRARKRKAASREDEKNEAIARIIGEGKELDNAFYNAEILEDIALGTNLGPWSPNGFVSRRYTDLLSNKERRPISRLFSWFLGSPSDGDLYSSDSSLLFSRDGLRRNPALPKLEFLRVERINERLDSYGFSVQAAVRSRAVAATALKQKNFERAFGLAVGASVGGSGPLNEKQLSALTTAELFFLKRSANTVGQIHACDRELRDLMMKRTFQNMEIEKENGESEGRDSGDEEGDNKQDAESSEANTMTLQGADGEEFEIIIETDESKPSRAQGLFGRSKSDPPVSSFAAWTISRTRRWRNPLGPFFARL